MTVVNRQDVLDVVDSYIHEIITESGTDKNAHTNKILRLIKSDIDNIPASDNVLDEIRAEIAEYGSLRVSYAITNDTKTDKGIEKLVSDVLKRAKEEVLDIIDKYKESEGEE